MNINPTYHSKIVITFQTPQNTSSKIKLPIRELQSDKKLSPSFQRFLPIIVKSFSESHF